MLMLRKPQAFVRATNALIVPLFALSLVLAACGDDDPAPANDATASTGIQVCGAGPGPACPSYGSPVFLEITSAPDSGFFDNPGGRIVAYPGEEIMVRIDGFAPGEEARIFATNDLLNGTTQRPDDTGRIEFPVVISGAPGPDSATNFYAVVQQPEDGSDPVVGTFIVMTPGASFAEGPQREVLGDALDSIGAIGGAP